MGSISDSISRKIMRFPNEGNTENDLIGGIHPPQKWIYSVWGGFGRRKGKRRRNETVNRKDLFMAAKARRYRNGCKKKKLQSNKIVFDP